MNKKIVACLIIILLIIVVALAVIIGLKKENSKTDEQKDEVTIELKNDFFDKIEDVSYVVLSYSGEEKKLDNELASILAAVDNDDIKDENYYKKSDSNADTGEQEYIFRFYNDDDELVYHIQYKKSSKRVTIYGIPVGESSKFYVINEKVEKYIENHIRGM